VHPAIQELLLARGTEYFLFDQNFRILQVSPRGEALVEAFLDRCVGEDLRQGFPELFGVEEAVQRVLLGEQQRLEFKGVTRLSATEEPIYLDLQIVRTQAETPQLLLLIEDVSDRMVLEQTLVQSTNETSLLIDSLQASQDSLNAIVSAMADALLIVSPNGTMQMANRAAQTLFGYRFDELKGQPVTLVITDRRFVAQEVHQYLLNQSEYVKNVEVECRTKTGDRRLVAFSCSKIRTNADTLPEFLYIGRDVTARQRSEQRFVTQYRTARILSLANSLKKAMPPILKAIGENLGWALGELWRVEAEPEKNIPIPTANTNQEPSHLRCIATWSQPSEGIRHSPAIQAFLAASEPASLRRSVSLAGWVGQTRQAQWIANLEREEHFERRELAAAAGLQSALAIPIESDTRLCGVMVLYSQAVQQPDRDTLQTMTAIANQLGQFIQRKQAEAALQESEERYRDLFENASDLIQSVDPNGRFLYVNRAWQEAMGYSLSELERQTVFELVHPIEKIKFAKAFRRLLEGGTIDPMKTAFVTKSGSQVFLEGSMNCKRVGDRPVAVRAIFHDITQRLKAEKALALQQKQAERLLLNILPARIAQRLKKSSKTIAEKFEWVTVLFADIVGFTEMAGQLPPIELVDLLNSIFSEFDRRTETYGLEKIKTIGDAYMVVGGLPERRSDHAEAIADFALEMQSAIAQFNNKRNDNLKMRIGIHSGPVVAGVIGLKKFIYDLWGDTVNIASRMESHGAAGRIQVSDRTYQLLQANYQFEHRGRIPVKGKGEMDTYWLLRKR